MLPALILSVGRLSSGNWQTSFKDRPLYSTRQALTALRTCGLGFALTKRSSNSMSNATLRLTTSGSRPRSRLGVEFRTMAKGHHRSPGFLIVTAVLTGTYGEPTWWTLLPKPRLSEACPCQSLRLPCRVLFYTCFPDPDSRNLNRLRLISFRLARTYA